MAGLLGPAKIGAAEDWPLFRHDAARTGASAESISFPLSPLWNVSTGGQWIVSSPAVVDNVLYVGVVEDSTGLPEAQKGSFRALNAETGKALWRFPAEGDIGPVYSSPAVTKESIFFACRDGYFYCLTRDGQLRWKTRTGGLDHSSPVLCHNKVIFASGAPNRGLIIALDAETGEIAWQNDRASLDSDSSRQFTYTSLSSDDHSLYFLDRNGEGVSLDPETGDVRWRNTVGKGAYFFTPTLIGSGVFYASDQNASSASALKADTGFPLWSFPYEGISTDSTVSSAAAAGNTLVFSVGTETQTLYSLRSDTGDPLWKHEIGQGNALGFASSPAIAGDEVVVGASNEDGTGSLVVLHLQTGEEMGHFSVPGAVVSSPAISGGRVFIGDLAGNLHAYAVPLDPGDITGDGKVNVQDAILILKAAVGLVILSSRQQLAGDLAPASVVDGAAPGDGRINALDAVAILRKAVGLVGTPVTPPTDPETPVPPETGPPDPSLPVPDESPISDPPAG